MNQSEKRQFLSEFVPSDQAIDELMVYTQNKFIANDQAPKLHHKEFIETWEDYHKESQELGAFQTLQKYLVQLQFPVKQGISKTDDYRNATLRGKRKLGSETLQLNEPDKIQFELHEDPMIGKVPVLVISNNEDFDTLVCALSNKNEPTELPGSMGALFINGLNNWNRIRTLQVKWLQENPFGNWAKEFKENILPNTHLYKDKLMLLSTKGYSKTSHTDIGISEEEWKSASLIIRREHECAHMFTLQHYGSMANNMHDEIVADYAGITEVLGHFNQDWFLHFMGLEDYPHYRKGGRLQNYQSPIQLSEEAFQGLTVLIKRISETIAKFDATLGNITSSEDRLDRMKSICEVDMITMATPAGLNQLTQKYNSLSVLSTT